MLRHPGSSSRAGLATRGTLTLVLAGAGSVAFLFLVLPRLTSARAEERGPHVVQSADDAATEESDDVELDPAQVLDPAPDEAETTALAAPEKPAVAAAASLVDPNAPPGIPSLKRLNTTGPKAPDVPAGSQRAQQRKDRKEREKAAAENGEQLQARAPKTSDNPNRSRLQQMNEKGQGRPQARDGGKKGKKQKPEDAPADNPPKGG